MENPTIEDDDRFMTLFEAALRLASSKRGPYLRDACRNDPDLVRTLETQLACEERMGEFLLDPLIRCHGEKHPFQPGTLIGGRFRILREVGEGGMGVIYEATDEKLVQRRALKCAKAGFQRRLSPEARAAMRVTHDNVCRVYEIHTAETEEGPVDFLCMEYVEGETLAERLQRNGPLPSSEAQTILEQLCAGLGAAHQEGLLHRDLKSNNVMLSRSARSGVRVVITDFGLARDAATDLGGILRLSSSLRGTPAYIAPELWLGAKASVASDIYALGVIAYEMIAGRRPFPVETPFEERLERLPEPPSKSVPKLDAEWDRTILRCLDPDPLKRFADVTEVLESLAQTKRRRRRTWIWGGGAAAVAAALLQAAVYIGVWPPSTSQSLAAVRLAVLPMQAASHMHLPDGLMYDLSDRLQRLPDKRFVTIPVAESVKEKVNDAKTGGSRLGATHVLLCSVDRSREKMALTAKVIDARTGIVVRKLESEYDFGNLNRMTRALLGTVTAAFELNVAGMPDEKVAPAAYPYYAQGISLRRRDKRSNDLAIRQLKRAIRLDGNSALPYAELSDAYLFKSWLSGDRQWLDRAREALHEAESRNPDLALVHIEAGNLNRVGGSFEKAVTNYLRAIQLEPTNADAWHFLARAYQQLEGRQPDAAQAYQKAVDLQPGYFGPEMDFGVFYFKAGDYVEAEKHFRRVVELAPGLVQGHSNLCGLYGAMGSFDRAEQFCRQALQLQESADALNNLGLVLEGLRRDSEALLYYQRAITLAPMKYLFCKNAGDCYRRLQRTAEATGAYRKGRELAEDALTQNPSDGRARSFLGYFAARLGDVKTGERQISQALQLAPQDTEALGVAAAAEEVMHYREKALALLRGVPRDLLFKLNSQPDMADFRRDPRFQSMLALHGNK